MNNMKLNFNITLHNTFQNSDKIFYTAPILGYLSKLLYIYTFTALLNWGEEEYLFKI